jgi:hypothetical protein
MFRGIMRVHRMAQANFNIRGWQGRWRYTASTALFFISPSHSAASAVTQITSGEALSPAVLMKPPCTEAPALAALLHLLEFPEHPHKGTAQTEDDTQ